MVRNDDGSLEEIGGIEGNNPNKIPERKKGPVSLILQTGDIEGAQPGTKGLGVFAHHQRKTIKSTNKIDDIAGSTVGSLRKGVLTNRTSNPLVPDYAMPGSTEYGENNAFGMVAKQVVQKPIQVPTAPKVTKPPFKIPNNINREHFKRDITTFYGTDDKNFADIDFNKLYKATKDPKAMNTAPGVPPDLQEDMTFKRNSKKFYGQSQTSESELNFVQNKFYDDGVVTREIDQNRFTGLSQGVTGQKVKTPIEGQHLKRAQAQFYGVDYAYSDQGSERGSIFQHNAANFYGCEPPAPGERPFKISDNDTIDQRKNEPKNVSILNERKLQEHERNMQRDPKFGKNLRKFWGMKSQATNSNMASSNRSYAQQLDQFIAK